MLFNSHDSSTAADIEIEGGSTQNSWTISSKICGTCSTCTSKNPWVDSYLHNCSGEVLLQWKFDPSKSQECPWNTKLVCLWPFPPSSYQFEWQTTLRCYWSTARSNTEKIHLQHDSLIHTQADSSAHRWEFLCTNPPPLHILDIAIKWFSLWSRSL